MEKITEYPCYIVRFSNGHWLKSIVYSGGKIESLITTSEWREAKLFAVDEVSEIENFVPHLKDTPFIFAGIYEVDLAEPEYVDLATVKKRWFITMTKEGVYYAD